MTPTVVYFRGIPDIARQKDLELHNRWNLEFDTDQIPGCRELMDTPLDRPAQRYFWSRRIDLKDTWESAMLLCVPIVGSDGTVYGICGVEISALYFQLSYPAAGWTIRLRRYRSGPYSGQPSPAVGWIGRQCQRHLSGRPGDTRHPPGTIL